MPEFCVVLTTCADAAEASRIAEELVTQRLAACVNVVSGVSSTYRWQGKLEHSQEALLVIKSKKKLFDEIARMIKNLHSYACPEIISLPIGGGFEPYLQWVDENTR